MVRDVEQEYQRFEKDLTERIFRIARGKEHLHITREERRFLGMEEDANKLSIYWGDNRFREAYRRAAQKYGEVIDARVDYVSTMRGIEGSLRSDDDSSIDGENGYDPSLIRDGRETQGGDTGSALPTDVEEQDASERYTNPGEPDDDGFPTGTE
ncbi:MAG: hypothetical protein ACE5ES_04605 [Candidatus Nanoarchaeia archaeon]